jgi:hypothetical protein
VRWPRAAEDKVHIVAAGLGNDVEVVELAGEVDRSVACTLFDLAGSLGRGMVQLVGLELGTDAEDRVCNHLAAELARHIGSRIRKAGTAEGAYCIADTAAVAVLASVERHMLVDHREYDHTAQPPGIACLAFPPAFLLISQDPDSS